MNKDQKTFKKIIKVIYFVVVYVLALIGFVFTGMFFAIRWGVTDVNGGIDELNERFQERSKETQLITENLDKKIVSSNDLENIQAEMDQLNQKKELKIKNLCTLNELSYSAPKNVDKILKIKDGLSDTTVYQMTFAVESYLSDQNDYKKNIENCIENFNKTEVDETIIQKRIESSSSQNIFPWAQEDKWQTIVESVGKDEEVIKMAAKAADLDPRLIVSDLVVEQLRVYYSARELYEKYFEPLKILSNMNKMSLGVMGIKEATAIQIENHLKDSTSAYYLGKNYENILDYGEGQNKNEVRYARLTSDNHYYSYLYAALYLKQMIVQWKNAGFDISNRPEVIGTLFNVGFPQSNPNADPKVGGSKVQIGQYQYTFGRLSFEFFYSGEMTEQFPYQEN